MPLDSNGRLKKGKESETEVAWPSVVIFIVLL